MAWPNSTYSYFNNLVSISECGAGIITIDSYLNYVKLATRRMLRKLREIVETRSLSVLLLFEGDPIAYKI